MKNRKWHFEIAYKYHAINDLVEGSKKVEDDTKRRRNAQSLLLDIRYALFRNFTLRAIFSLARHERGVGISAALPVHTQGLGDSMLSLQYTLFLFSDRNQTEVSLGGGIKLPLGHSDARTIGIGSEDMQPGNSFIRNRWFFLPTQGIPETTVYIPTVITKRAMISFFQ